MHPTRPPAQGQPQQPALNAVRGPPLRARRNHAEGGQHDGVRGDDFTEVILVTLDGATEAMGAVQADLLDDLAEARARPLESEECYGAVRGFTADHFLSRVAIGLGGPALAPIPLEDVDAVADGNDFRQSVLIHDFVPSQQVGRVVLIPDQAISLLVGGGTGAGVEKDEAGGVLADLDSRDLAGQKILLGTVRAHPTRELP